MAVKVEFYLSDNDVDRLFAIKEDQGKNSLSGNEFARELVETSLHRLHMENHKAYIQNWIAALEQNPNELFAAIKEAGKISDYLLTKGEFLTKERIQESKKQQQEQPENQQIRKKVQSSGRRR